LRSQRRRRCWSSAWRLPGSSWWWPRERTGWCRSWCSDWAGCGPKRSTTSRWSPFPPPHGAVEHALLSLRGAPLLTGARGRPAVDVAAAARLAAGAGELLLRDGLELLELNPVIVHEQGAVAVDALARTQRTQT
jgi:hypothetical protein